MYLDCMLIAIYVHRSRWVMSHIYLKQLSARRRRSCHTHELVISHTWMSNVAHIWWVISRAWVVSRAHKSHVPPTNKSCRTCTCSGCQQDTVVERHVNKSCLSYKWIMSHVHESCLTCMSHVLRAWVMSHVWMSNVPRINKSLHSCTCSGCQQDTVVGEHVNKSCLTYKWVLSHLNESCLRVMSHIRISHVLHVCVMSHVRTSHVSHEWAMSHIQMSHVSHAWVMSHIRMGNVSHTNESCRPCTCSGCQQDAVVGE